MLEVSWAQVHGWRLGRQFLDPRGPVGVDDVVGRLCGVQAQVASSAELAVALRRSSPGPGPGPGSIESGLAERSLVRTWAMRGTLHVLRPADAGVYLSLLASARTWEKAAWQKTFGATPRQVSVLGDVVSEVLDGAVLTRDELVAAVAAHSHLAGLEEQLRSGWSALLKPLAWQGLLCQGPSRGGNVTFTRPDTWLEGWAGLPEPDAAGPAAVAAYLGAYGPATVEGFGAWLLRGAVGKATLRGWFAALGDGLTPVDVEGRRAWIRAEDADALAGAPPARSVRLLGAFDQYVLGPGTNDPSIVPQAHRSLVSRAGGWISPVVVVDGRVVGVWEVDGESVVLSPFPGAAAPAAADLDAEVDVVARATGVSGLGWRMGAPV